MNRAGFDRRSRTARSAEAFEGNYGSSPWRVDPSRGKQGQLRPFPLEGRSGQGENEPSTILRRPGGREKEPGTIPRRPGGREKEPSAALSRRSGRQNGEGKYPCTKGDLIVRGLPTLGRVDLRADYGSSPWRVDPSRENKANCSPSR